MKIKLGISLYRIFSRAYFYLPFLLIFFYQRGLSLFEMEIIMSIYGLGALFGNKLKQKIATSMLPKQLLILGEILKILGLVLLSLELGVWIYYIAQALLGLSYAFEAGEDSKIINTLENGQQIQQRTNAYMFISLLISGIVGSYLFDISNVLPIIFTIIASAICTISIIITLPSGEIQSNESYNEVDIGVQKFSKKEKYWIAHYSIIRGIILSLFTGFLPYHFFLNLHLSPTRFIFILTSYTLTGYIASKYFSNVASYISDIFLLLSLILFTQNNIIMILFGMVLLGFSSGLTRPQSIRELKKLGNLTKSLSTAELFYSLINIFFLLAGGLIYQNYNLQGVIYLSVILLSLCLILKRSYHEN